MTSNNVKTHNENLDIVEAMMDKCTLKDMVSLLAEIASGKADHIRETWGDEELADAWDNAASRITMAENNLPYRAGITHKNPLKAKEKI